MTSFVPWPLPLAALALEPPAVFVVFAAFPVFVLAVTVLAGTLPVLASAL